MLRPILSLLTLLCALGAAAQSGNGPQFSFKETAHDFGKVLPDSTLHYSFEFTNSGNQMLMITAIEPTCHCVSAAWQRRPFMPGERGTVDITYAAPIDLGRFDRGLMLVSNATNVDPSLMRYELRVRGEAVKELPKKASAASRTKRRTHGH